MRSVLNHGLLLRVRAEHRVSITPYITIAMPHKANKQAELFSFAHLRFKYFQFLLTSFPSKVILNSGVGWQLPLLWQLPISILFFPPPLPSLPSFVLSASYTTRVYCKTDQLATSINNHFFIESLETLFQYQPNLILSRPGSRRQRQLRKTS